MRPSQSIGVVFPYEMLRITTLDEGELLYSAGLYRFDRDFNCPQSHFSVSRSVGG